MDIPTEHASYQQVKNLIKQFTGQANTLIIPRVFIDFTGDHIAALLLSQILYWSDRTDDPDGWFYKTADEWDAELGMSAFQIKRASGILEKLGIDTKLRKVKGAPRMHYRVRYTDFINLFLKFLENQETGKSNNLKIKKVENGLSRNLKIADFQESSKSYIGTEITSETTSSSPSPPAKEKRMPDQQVVMMLYSKGFTSAPAVNGIASLGIDCETIAMSIENLRADGWKDNGRIMRRLQQTPPLPNQPYPRMKQTHSAPPPPVLPADALSPQQLAARLKAKRGTP